MGTHNATNGEVRRWGLASIAASLVAAGTIAAYFSGLWATAVEAGAKGRFATVEQVAAVTAQVEAIDAGAARKEDVQRVEAKVDRMESKLDRLIEIQLKQKNTNNGGR